MYDSSDEPLVLLRSDRRRSVSLLLVQVHELERNCRTLETEAQNLRVQTQELEEELSEAENSRLRLEVTLQALKAQFEREISTAEEKGEEKRRALSKQVERRSHRCHFYNPPARSNSTPFQIQGEGVGDPSGGREESALSGHVIQEAAGRRAAGIRGTAGNSQPWKRRGHEAAAAAPGTSRLPRLFPSPLSAIFTNNGTARRRVK